jgi:hypothetical protein
MMRALSYRSGVLLQSAFFVSPLATSVAPRLAPLFFAILSALLIEMSRRRGMNWRNLLEPRPALAVCLILAAYLFLNATWSLDRPAAFQKAALLAGLLLIGFAAVQAVTILDANTVRRAALAFALGAFGGALFVLIELLTHGMITRTAINNISLLQPESPKRLKISSGRVIRVSLPEFNQNVNLAMFHLWSGLLGLMALRGTVRIGAMLLFFGLISTVVFISAHGSSQLALVGSSIVVMAIWIWRRFAIITLVGLWLGAFMLVIPASFVAYQSGLHLLTWLPSSSRARVILWEFTAEQTLNNPLLGVGAESTPVVNEKLREAGLRDEPEGFVFARSVGHHAHNIFLNSWYELGAIGTLLFAVAGAAIVLLIMSLPALAQPFAGGCFAAFALVAAFSWGMWQTWFMCATALMPLYLCVVSRAFENTENCKLSSAV